MSQKKRLLTGDTPTGRLHLGHYVGSVENRLALQDEYDCFFIIANKHAFTTRADKPDEIRQSVLDIAADWLACGIDPAKSAMLVQSEVPAIDELTFFFSMLLPFNRVMRNPTLKDEIRDKGLGDNYPFGFPLYTVGQCADILAFRPAVVPVGEDQLPHLELSREVARRFDQVYCGVDPQTEDHDYISRGGLFPIIEPKLGRVTRLCGTGGPGPDGKLQKMSKSLNNAILLSDDAETVKKKVMGMYTDPKRLRATDPGTTENNPLWIFHETFNTDTAWIAERQEAYRQGKVGDVEIKRKLIEILNTLLEPIRTRRKHFEERPDDVLAALRQGTKRANEVAEETLYLAKVAMKQDYVGRRVMGFPDCEAEGTSIIFDFDLVLDILSRSHQRATYAAVAIITGSSAQHLMRGRPRDARHSWVVNGETHLPTDYAASECDPKLEQRKTILSTGRELWQWLTRPIELP